MYATDRRQTDVRQHHRLMPPPIRAGHNNNNINNNNNNKLCGRPPQYVPAPVTLTFDLESGVQVTCDVGYLCANFSLYRPLCS